MLEINEKLIQLGLTLPEPPPPGGNYVSVNIRSNIVYLSIQFPKLNGQLLYLGRLGYNLSTEEGYKAFQLCALNVLAHINNKPGINEIEGLNHFDAYYQAYSDWDEAPLAVNGASDLFLEVLGEKGNHTRAIFGVERLPRNFSVGITASFTLK